MDEHVQCNSHPIRSDLPARGAVFLPASTTGGEICVVPNRSGLSTAMKIVISLVPHPLLSCCAASGLRGPLSSRTVSLARLGEDCRTLHVLES